MNGDYQFALVLAVVLMAVSMGLMLELIDLPVLVDK